MDLPPPVELHGDVRVSGDSLGEADLRLRTRPSLGVRELGVHAIADVQTDKHPVALVAAWTTLETPVGLLHAGRMPIPHWGLGLVADPGGGLDDPGDFTVDRVGFATEFARHQLGLAYDRGHAVTLTAGFRPTDLARRRALDVDRNAWGYGAFVTRGWRPGLESTLVDGWGRFETGRWRFEAEGAWLHGHAQVALPGAVSPVVDVDGYAAAVQLAWAWAEVELGWTGGQPLVSEQHAIDRVSWRGTGLRDTPWVRGSVAVPLGGAFTAEPWTTLSERGRELGLTTSFERGGASLMLHAAYADSLRAEGWVAWSF